MPSLGMGFGLPGPAGPGPSVESFKKDGFNILGKEAIK